MAKRQTKATEKQNAAKRRAILARRITTYGLTADERDRVIDLTERQGVKVSAWLADVIRRELGRLGDRPTATA